MTLGNHGSGLQYSAVRRKETVPGSQARGTPSEFTEGVIKEIILITGGGICIAGYVIVLYINQ